jgi:aconitate hydratase
MHTLEASLAGPKRPQDRVPISALKDSFRRSLSHPVQQGGFELAPEALTRKAVIGADGSSAEIGHGAVVIAAHCSAASSRKRT